MFFKNEFKTMLARGLRRKATPTEELAWQMLRGEKYKGHKFRRQFVMSGFILDFYCIKLKLAIELDGPIHNKQKDYDKARENILIQEHGLRILRIRNEELRSDPNILYQKLDQFLSPSPPREAGLERGGVNLNLGINLSGGEE